MYDYEAQAERVVDGDTVILLIDLGFNLSPDVEPAGVHQCARAERSLAVRADRCPRGQSRPPTLIEGKKVNVISKSLDKYGRALVHIHTIQSAPVDVNQFMLDNGFAVPM